MTFTSLLRYYMLNYNGLLRVIVACLRFIEEQLRPSYSESSSHLQL